ncbi:MAG: DUF3127 domain-containing protein [Bacteroidales bacterium]|jgi:hypothetical protein
MDFNARILEVKEPQIITTKNGEFTKHNVIVETLDNYPKKICLSYWNDRIASGLLEEGKILNFSIDLESREYNGNWYTDVKLWKVSDVNDVAASNVAENRDFSNVDSSASFGPENSQGQSDSRVFEEDETEDDLPF